MKEMEIEVRNCYNCPFCDKGGVTGMDPFCTVSDDVYWDDVREISKKMVHLMCPLLKQSILVYHTNNFFFKDLRE